MEENNDRMGLLMLIDDIGLLISTFGVLLGYSALVEPVSTNVWIICLFFAGIKILLTGIADITGIGRKLWVSIIFIALADGIIIFVNKFMSFGLSNMLLLYTTIADVVVITIAYFVWKKIAGREIRETEERKEWIHSDGEEKQGDVLETEAAGEAVPVQSPQTLKAKPEAADTAAFDSDAFEALFTEETETADSAQDHAVETAQDQTAAVAETPASPEPQGEQVADEFDGFDLLFDEITSPLPEFSDYKEGNEPEGPEQKAGTEETQPDEDLFSDDLFSEITAPLPIISDEDLETPAATQTPAAPQPAVSTSPVSGIQDTSAVTEKPESETASSVPSQLYTEKENEICKELDTLLASVTKTAEKSKMLEENVSNFSSEVDNMPAITSEDDIVESGRLIRSKLRTIIDKQFVMDDVMNEVIKTSDKINKRIETLNKIEAELKERERRIKEREDQTSASLFNQFTSPLQKISDEDVMNSIEESEQKLNKMRKEAKASPEELVLQAGGYEIIINADDFDAVKTYLASHPV
ncbi:MAG: hypothetical protein ACOYB8_01785 [Eubacteriaceae bacterium]|jgi:uncharacterized membrane protein